MALMDSESIMNFPECFILYLELDPSKGKAINMKASYAALIVLLLCEMNLQVNTFRLLSAPNTPLRMYVSKCL